MAKQLNAEQKTVGQIFTECRKAFLIPEYQRPYSWERDILARNEKIFDAFIEYLRGNNLLL